MAVPPRDDRITRRAFLPLVVLGAGIPGLVFSVWRLSRRPVSTFAPLVAPRFRHRKLYPPARVTLPSGLYLNQRSKIAHYVDESGFIRRVTRINESHLTLVPASAFDARTTMPRVNADTAAGAFEGLARQRLRAGNVEEALNTLERGIDQDLALIGGSLEPVQESSAITSQATTFRPRFNLYDLFARESVRAGQSVPLQRFIARVQRLPVPVRELFSTRLAKWTDTSGPWYKKHATPAKTL